MNTSTLSLDISAEEEVLTEQLRHIYNCKDCSYHTRFKSNLNKHVKRMHPVQGTTKESYWPCDACGKNFKSRFGLELHVKNKHKKEFIYTCKVCNKGYNQRIQFRYHLSSHSSVGLDKCKSCRKELNSNGSLKRHLDTCPFSQNKSQPFICDICQSTFSKKYKLDEHRRGKHGEKKYACTSCGNRYGWRSSLKAHSKVWHLKKQ